VYSFRGFRLPNLPPGPPPLDPTGGSDRTPVIPTYNFWICPGKRRRRKKQWRRQPSEVGGATLVPFPSLPLLLPLSSLPLPLPPSPAAKAFLPYFEPRKRVWWKRLVTNISSQNIM